MLKRCDPCPRRYHRFGRKCDIFTNYGDVAIDDSIATQNATFLYCGVSADNGVMDRDHVLYVGEAHDHALADLHVAFDQASVADMSVLDDHAFLNTAVPADGDISLQYDIT